MRKPAKKPPKTRASKPKPMRATKGKPAHLAADRSQAGKKPAATSKQARVIDMLQSSAGTTIAAMMHATGWQAHSVRGFLAGVVRKKLKLKLNSEKVDGDRIYRVEAGETPSTQCSNRRAA
jgi:hypothetical protein